MSGRDMMLAVQQIRALRAALLDAVAGLHYIREHYHDERTATGDLYGVGFDRVDVAATAALNLTEEFAE